MSHQASNWAAAKIVTTHACKTVLLVLAEAAHDDGREARLSQWNIAVRAGLSDRGVRLALKSLEGWGLVRRGDQSTVAHLPADQRPVVWDLNLSAVGYFGVEQEDLEAKRKERNKRSNGRKKAKTVDTTEPGSGDTAASGSAVAETSNVMDCGTQFRGTTESSSVDCGTQFRGTAELSSPRTVLGTVQEPSDEPSLLLPQQPPLLAPVEDLPGHATIVDPFDELYDTYPQTGGLKYARDAFNDVMRRQLIDYPTLLRAVHNYAADPEVQRKLATPSERQYIPQLKRWLEDKRWKAWANPPAPARTKSDEKFVRNLSRGDNPNEVLRLLQEGLSPYMGADDQAAALTTHQTAPELGAA